MKGIVLAGGSGTRMYPLTKVLSKQLLPVYDKPMVYYPLSTLMLAGIRDILIISTPLDLPHFQNLLGNGSQWGLHLSYAEQRQPNGLAEAFLIGENFIRNESVCLILGDNIFYGEGLQQKLRVAARHDKGATIFGYYVSDPERYGVLGFDSNWNVTSIEEKPKNPKSNYAVVGLYFYDKYVSSYAKTLQSSSRGELEITDLNQIYMKQGLCKIEFLGRGTAWLDTGTSESLMQASHFVEAVESRQGLKISCPEEIAWRMGYIETKQLKDLAKVLSHGSYGKYLLGLVEAPSLPWKDQFNDF